MANEPGAAVLTLFSNLIDYIKQSRPVQSDGKTPVNKDFFYSTMILGMPIDPSDFEGPWSPAGGDSLQDALTKNGLAAGTASGAGGNGSSGSSSSSSSSTSSASSSSSGPTSGGASSSGGGTAVATPPAPAPDYTFMRAMQAAYKTSVLCNIALQVTSDGSYLEYPGGKHLDFAYHNILGAMQGVPAPPIAPDVQKRIDDAKKVLWMPDPYDPNNQVETPVYARYKQNSIAYAQAKANFAMQQALALRSPATAEVWPELAAAYQEKVDETYDSLKTEGAEVVEPALATLESVGQSMQNAAIAAARKSFDNWSMNISGAPVAIPYSFVMPTNWCVPNVEDDGFESLTVTSDQYSSTDATGWSRNTDGSWNTSSSSTSGGGGVSFGFASFGGGGGTSKSDAQWQGSVGNTYSNTFSNNATGLTISLKYGLVTLYRPWCQVDLFSMDSWYMVNNKKNCISDGTVAGQVGNTKQLFPALPTQFLVIKDVEITATDWGDDGQTLASYYGGDQGSTHTDSTSEAGGGGVCLGFISFGGTASHSDSHASGQGSSWQQANGSHNFGAHFDGTTLRIPGAQIIAFVCDIIPASPPLDDPGLASKGSN